MKHILKVILNWFKIPFQLSYSQTPIELKVELHSLDQRHIVLREDQTLGWYSNNFARDGFSHDTDNQFVNQCLYLYLYEESIPEIEKNALLSWVIWNLHAGVALSNGISWPQDGIHFAGLNTSTETLAALNLLMTNSAYTEQGMLPEYYEALVEGIIKNDMSLNFICNPGGELSQEYDRLLKEAHYRPELVKLKNPATDMSLGCDPDKAVVLLATLMVLIKCCGLKKYQKLFDKYEKLYGYGLKARGTSNSLEAISSIFILENYSPNSFYTKLLNKKFGCVGYYSELEDFLYSKLLGVK